MATKKKNSTKSGDKPKRGLGRGLSQLISADPVPIKASAKKEKSIQIDPGFRVKKSQSKTMSKVGTSKASLDSRMIDINLIINNPKQPRQEFREADLAELAESIKELGVLQPILLRPSSVENGMYEIVAGERRWRACSRLKLKEVPVIVKEMSDVEALEIAIVENVQRQSLSPLEEAEAYKRLSDEFHLSQQQIALRVGKDRSTISNFLRILKLPSEVQSLIESSVISIGHAKAILTVKEPKAQLNLAKKCVEEKLSVRELEEIVGRVVSLKSKGGSKKVKSSNSDFPEVCDRLRNIFGTKVRIVHSKKTSSGKIEISYFSEDELDRLVRGLGA